MQAIEVDERDSTWERDDPRYRLYVFDGRGSTMATFDLIDASWHDVEWSGQTLAEQDKLWSAALVVDDSQQGRGLIWLSGGDYNSPPRTAREWRMRAQMQDRYLSARARRSCPSPFPMGGE